MNNDILTYKVPSSGNYLMPASVFHCIPTGKYETVYNPHRRFFEFWKPRYVQIEIFKTDIKYSGMQVMYLKKDQILEIKGPIHKI